MTKVFWSVSLTQDDDGTYHYQLDSHVDTDRHIVGMHLAAMANHFGYNPNTDNYKSVIELLNQMPKTDEDHTA